MEFDNIAIQVKGLGKKYAIGGPQEKYFTFRDAIVNSMKAPFRWFSSREPPQEIWALKDVSFEVEQGEVVGIIGRNGAGKSTLLKILSRITSPTEGTVDLYGRVGSLLEVGTGFHPELTGRENIFLSGSILGMKKREIDDKLDDIVKFSEIEKFLDTPAKRYSSGMYVRLAFAVAAHLETEILLVDEVLAVGDAAFQKKCLGKMDEVAKEGRTVLFVSHNMAAVSNLCKTGFFLQEGRVDTIGPMDSIISSYINSIPVDNGINLRTIKERVGNGKVRIIGIKIEDFKNNKIDGINIGDGCKIIIDYEAKMDFYPHNVEVGIVFKSILNVNVVMFSNLVSKHPFNNLPKSGKICCVIPSLPLANGIYSIGVSFSSDGETNDWVDHIMKFTIQESDFYGSGKLYNQNSTCLYLNHNWEYYE